MTKNTKFKFMNECVEEINCTREDAEKIARLVEEYVEEIEKEAYKRGRHGGYSECYNNHLAGW